MQDLAFGNRLRSVRVRLGMQQVEVARRAGVSDGTVSRIERGHLDSVSIRSLRAVASALEIRVDLTPRWRGGDLERAVSARHARLAETAIRWLTDHLGWAVRPEVSFSIYGERGIIDLLAWHEARRALLVIELKTEIVDVGETIGTLDRKARLAGAVAADLGWAADAVSVCLIVADGRSNHRRLSDHAATFRAALPDDGRRLRGWLRDPIGRLLALTFLPDRHRSTARPTGSASCRVRRRRGELRGPR
ncbi:MAG: helix-turn-helix transcriptional regulator [Chloroflexota bacterium]